MMPNLLEVDEYFRKCLSDFNHPLDKEIAFDEGWQKYCCPDSRTSKSSARYCAHSDGKPVLKFQCMKCGLKKNFIFGGDLYKGLSEAERSKILESNSKKKAEKSYQEEKERQKILKVIQETWQKAKPCLNHEYFKRKHLTIGASDGLRIDAMGRILCPVQLITGELISLQTIPTQGKKLFSTGVPRKNGFCVFGSIEDSEVIYYAEGVATSLTVRLAVNKPVVCTYGKFFSDIAPILRNKYPDKKFIYCCDLPSPGEKITSQDNARKAQAICGGDILLPQFSFIEKELEEDIDLTDYNDLLALLLKSGRSRDESLAEVTRQLLIKQDEENCNMDASSYKENTAQNEDNVKPFPYKIDISDFPDRKGNKILNTYGNLKYLLSRLGITVHWNMMAHIREVRFPKFKVFIDDAENSALREVTNLAEIHGMPTSKIDDHLTSLAQQNPYHPIKNCILANPWDGVPRLEKFIKTIKSEKDNLSNMLIRRWMMTAVAALFNDKGFASQGVLVLQGRQYLGKTSWIKNLDPCNCNAVKEGMILDPANKDSVTTCSSHWIVELGELEGTFRKADLARLKSFITSDVDVLRFPFARKNSRIPRRTVFAASVNEHEFLIDTTGNRRFWVIPVNHIDLGHGLDMKQVWSEAYFLWQKGERTNLNQDEYDLLNESNIEHEQQDPFEESVLNYFDFCPDWRKCNVQKMTAGSVIELLYGCKSTNVYESIRMGKILEKLTGEKPKKKNNGRFYTLPVRKVTQSDTY